MIDIYTQDGRLALTVKSVEEIRAEIVHATSAFETDKNFWLAELRLTFSDKTSEKVQSGIVHTTDAFDKDKHFWLVELYRVRPNYDCMEKPMTTCADCALYRTKDEAASELLRLWRQFGDNGAFDKFQFKQSDINALELVKLRTAFI